MSNELKAIVLAKCEVAKNGKIQWLPYMGSELPLEMFEDHNGRSYFQIGGKMFVVTLQFREDTHEDSICWPIAAQILGIKPEPSPSDGLLARAWESGFIIGSCKTPFSDAGKAAALESFLRFAKYCSNALE